MHIWKFQIQASGEIYIPVQVKDISVKKTLLNRSVTSMAEVAHRMMSVAVIFVLIITETVSAVLRTEMQHVQNLQIAVITPVILALVNVLNVLIQGNTPAQTMKIAVTKI
jgi:hypothetical protein